MAGSRTSYNSQHTAPSSFERSPLPFGLTIRKTVVGIAIVFVALIALVFIGDIVGNFDKVHAGVTVEGVDVGGLSREDAATRIEQELGARIAADHVNLFANQEARDLGVDETTVEVTAGSSAYDSVAEGVVGTSWRITSASVEAAVDAAALAEEAYAVGRGADFFSGRFSAIFGGVALEADLNFEQAHLDGLMALLSKSIGYDMVNASLDYVEGVFTPVDGSEGYAVDGAAFAHLLEDAFLRAERSAIVPMTTVPLDVTYDEAAAVAAIIQERIATPVTLVYGDEEPWTVDSYSLGSWVATFVEGAKDAAKLTFRVDEEWVEAGIHAIIGDRDPGIKPVDARFELAGDAIRVVPGENGSGVDYSEVAARLHEILFSADWASRERVINLTVNDLEPAFTTQMAQDMHITDKIASYTTEFTAASANKATNIQLAADLLNYSMIAPGATWSFHDTAGECNAERGFKQATSIIAGEYVDEIGGGICQVATTVFNAVFESGLPIMERVNHAFYLLAYPAGRDAAVSWRWPDLKFQNDTVGSILLTMSYTDGSLTCTLWGTDPGYKVEVSDTGFTDRTDYETKEIENPELKEGEKRVKQEGVRGRTIVVTRIVYDREGKVLRETAFKSVYDPETEIIEIGTKKATSTPEESTGATPPTTTG